MTGLRRNLPSRVAWSLVLLCLISPDGFANSRFDAWTIDNGLPQNSFSAILQTRDGYLWLVTNGGLVRYDGVRFSVFDVANSPGIKSNCLTALFKDRDGSLWIGTEDSGLSRYRDGRFTAYTTEEGLPSNLVMTIAHDGQSCHPCGERQGAGAGRREEGPEALTNGRGVTNVIGASRNTGAGH